MFDEQDLKYIAKYKVPLTGKYNVAVYECPYCGHSILDTFYNEICGFAESQWGVMKVVECPHCFEKYFSHLGHGDLSHFHWAVKRGENKHFKELKDEQDD